MIPLLKMNFSTKFHIQTEQVYATFDIALLSHTHPVDMAIKSTLDRGHQKHLNQQSAHH